MYELDEPAVPRKGYLGQATAPDSRALHRQRHQALRPLRHGEARSGDGDRSDESRAPVLARWQLPGSASSRRRRSRARINATSGRWVLATGWAGKHGDDLVGPSEVRECSHQGGQWRSAARAYAVTPTEQVQRVSTASRNASSLETALAVGAAGMGDVAKLNAGIGYLRTAPPVSKLWNARHWLWRSLAGRRTARQGDNRPPSSAGCWDPSCASTRKHAIWCIASGPRTHELLVDLSAPVWWPRLSVTSSAGWRTQEQSR